jgi:hypothetical protein
VGIDPETAIWMTPREIDAALRGWMRRQRIQTVMHPMSEFDSEQEARAFIEGNFFGRAPSGQQQEKRLQELADKHDWNLE